MNPTFILQIALPIAGYLLNEAVRRFPEIIDRFYNSKCYQVLDRVYEQIDPEIIKGIESEVRFLELIRTAVQAGEDGEFSEAEISKVASLVMRDFKLNKMFAHV